MFNRRQFMIGQYRPGTGLLHRMDARAKIIFVFLVMIAALLNSSAVLYAALIVAQLSLLISCRLGWRLILGNLKPVVLFIAFTALFHLLFSGRDDPEIVFSFWIISVSKTAVFMAVMFSARILIFVLATFVLSLTTSPLTLSEAIVALLTPLRRIGIPIYDLGMVLFVALRFIPVLANEFDMIRKAQFIRGVEISGSIKTRIKRSVALILPVFFSALRRADDLSVAIETRGYRSGQPRSSLHPQRFHATDFVVLGLTFTILGFYIIGSRWWW
jgi:energy-coupling factor transport system permease protein